MKPYYVDESVTLYHGDALEVLQQLPDASVDAVVTDPPYGLEFMGREWDSFKPAAARLRTRVDQRTNPAEGKSTTTTPESYVAGAPYQQWCEAWASEALRVLKPGGHLLAFGGTRTVHRLTCAIEDAGFEIRDGIDWIYASGFPKSLDVSKAIDRKRQDSPHWQRVGSWLRARRSEAGVSTKGLCAAIGAHGAVNNGGAVSNWETGLSCPTWEQWEAMRAVLGFGDDMDAEVWRLNGRKGQPGEAWQNAEVVGIAAGAMSGWSMDGGTKFIDREIKAPATDDARRWAGWGTALKPAREPIVMARKPLAGTVAANVLVHATGALNIDACRVEGRERTDYGLANATRSQGAVFGVPSASADFDSSKGRWPANVAFGHDCPDRCEPGCPVGELGEMARFFPVFRYEAKAPTAERPRTPDGTAHPTVKPLDLMRWLVRLVTPTGGTVLEPFAGSGTTAEACVLEGFRCIAIERDQTYLPLITARLTKALQPALDFGAVA